MSWSSGDDSESETGDPAYGVAGRRSAVRQAVVDLVRTRPALVEDADLLDGYLRDVCPSQPAEVAVVVVAARGGVPDDLLHASEGHHVEAMAARLASRLNAESGIDQILARWAVDTWAIALGRSAAPAEVGANDGTAVTAAPPASPAPAPANPSRGEALRAMVAPVKPSGKSAKPAPAPVGDGATLAPAPASAPQKTRSRPTPAPPPTPAPSPSPARPSRRNIAIAASVVAALVAVAVVVSVSQGGGTEDAAPSPISTIDAVATSTSAAPTTSTEPPKQLPSSRGALTPGVYATSSFQPSMTLTVTGAWEMLTPQTSEFFEIRKTDAPIVRVSVMHLTEVFQAGAAMRTSADIRKPGAVEPVPGDVAGWLAANPNLSVGARSPVRTPGLSGTRLEVTVPTGYATELCGNPCVPLWPFKEKADEFGTGRISPGLRHVLYALDVRGQKVLVLVATADDAAQLVPEAEKAIAMLRFTG